MATSFVSGLDLGQAADYSCIVVLEATDATDPDTGAGVVDLAVRHMVRWPLGTPYTVVVDEVRKLFEAPPLRDSVLVVDRTGVGAPVVNLFEAAGIAAELRPFSITCGLQPGDGTVPKKDLVGAVQAALATGRLRFAEALELTPILVKELELFRVKITSDRNETYASFRERDHDDLVLALALAAWYATLNGPQDPAARFATPAPTNPYPWAPGERHPGSVESRPYWR